MKKENSSRVSWRGGKVAFHLIAFALLTTVGIYAQSATDAAAQTATDAMQRRVARARALAAAHDLAAAATELDAIRSAATDSSVRDVARIMLMGIHLEQGDYTRAGLLLDETYKARIAQDESSTRSYFALAGQAVNGARAHLERYREFGINTADKELPPESLNDLDRLRLLLERVGDQAKNISSEDSKSNDSIALLEDVASVRGSLARNERERSQWQREFAGARQKLAASETRVAMLRGTSNQSFSTVAAANVTARATSDNNTSSSRGSSLTSTSNPARPSVSRSATAAKPKNEVASTRSAANSSSSTGEEAAASNSSPTATKSNDASRNGQSLEVGSLVEKATQKISPSYPSAAKNARITGIVTVYLAIDEKGAVAKVERVSGPQMLRQTAQEAARRWKFRPTVIDGQPTRMTGFINFNFSL